VESNTGDFEMELKLGDCKEKMKEIESNTFDSIITDPPYELGFMGKKWDSLGIAYDVEVWKEALRVLKPGGHLLAFGATRTHHRMMVAIEDAGFEIRDCLMWVYGSGFPKGLNISKAIDKKLGATRKVIGQNKNHRSMKHTNSMVGEPHSGDGSITESATPSAKQWDGWGTALKPAYEPIVLARKPLSEKTIANNVLLHGTGGINIDDCRIGDTVESWPSSRSYPLRTKNNSGDSYGSKNAEKQQTQEAPNGRFPANVILDEVAGQILDEQSGDGGGASRFFYCAKASKKEKNAGIEANTHPTVKPIKLMEYLVRLITPPNGRVLDPFMGSGSTGCACVNLGFQFTGIELDEESFWISLKRIKHFKKIQETNR
tara:strand:- start:2763 stop:3881 length:1119 start_codon:yes stop_codon:yes gene_type:complete